MSQDTLGAMINLATTHHAAGNHGKAMKLATDALALGRRTFPAGDERTRKVMALLVTLYRSAGQEDEARELENELR